MYSGFVPRDLTHVHYPTSNYGLRRSGKGESGSYPPLSSMVNDMSRKYLKETLIGRVNVDVVRVPDCHYQGVDVLPT